MTETLSVVRPLTPRQKKYHAQIVAVRQALAAHDSNLALLQAFQQGRVSLKGKGYTRAATHYQPTPADRARLPRTQANLNAQRALLLKELDVLLEHVS
jgi:hypothetical protein